MRPAVLMTSPHHYAIRGGANPHTRNADQSLKVVDPKRSAPQWSRYVDQLLDVGVDVYVIDAVPALTGMVFAANAGFLPQRLLSTPSTDKVFYPSHFTAKHRQGESAHFARFMDKFGFRVQTYAEHLRFEGEADAFPIGRGERTQWIFTYGFRSDAGVGEWLSRDVLDSELCKLRLTDPKYYHGDCLFCDLGDDGLVWLGGIEPDDAARLQEGLGDRLLALDEDEAATFVGNSLYIEVEHERFLFSPKPILARTRSRIEERGVKVIEVDVSEFFGKGGGGPKCMAFHLGSISISEVDLSSVQQSFRHRHHARQWRQKAATR